MHTETQGEVERPRKPADAMFIACYERLKAMAGRHLSRARHSTLDTTSLVHELFIRVTAQRELAFERDEQFFAYAARAMRHVLADRARDRLRGGTGWRKITLNGDAEVFAVDTAEQALHIDEAIDKLARVDERAAKVLELYFFAGLQQDQIADLLGLTRRTVTRDWRFARAFLQSEVG